MEKEYITINRNTYNALAKEYENREYSVKEDFYINTKFKGLGFKKGKKILEIGPGKGNQLKIFDDFGMDITAVELSNEMCKLCKKKAPNATIINKNILECDFDKQFDYIYMNAVIHNFPISDAKVLLRLIPNWLNEDGCIICTTTVDNNDYEGFQEKQDYSNKSKRFRHHYTKQSFDSLFIDEGYNIFEKKYKEETDTVRSKLWQILYLKK